MKRFIMHRLLTIGRFTSYKSLDSYIDAIKEQNPAWQIELKIVDKDYIYKLINRDEILANIDKKLRSIK